MEKLPMCRICLAENVPMYVVINKNLHELYKRLTDIPFVTEDRRPIHACSICCAKLKQCCRLMMKCLETEQLFADMTNEDYERNPFVKQYHSEVFGGLVKTSLESISIVDVGLTEHIVVKEELPAVFESLDDIIEPKEGCQHDDIKQENRVIGYSDEKHISFPSIHFETDSKDDVPLMDFKTEVEEETDSEDDVPLMDFKTEVEEGQEIPKQKQTAVETSRSTVAEEPKLHLRRTKLEDSIPADRKTNQISDSVIIRNTEKRTSKYLAKFKKPHKCEICHYKFNTKSDFTKHVRTHTGEKPYKCDICQRSFGQKHTLTDHICTHTGEKPYKCDICQRSFSQRSTLTTHIRTHTGEKPYKCDICQHSFVQKVNLTDHIRRHTGEKPYKCDICQHSFVQKVNLTDHIRTHTGEKPYKCDICQRSFGQRFILTRHIRTHTGEKPYKCDICRSSFSDKGTLTKHIRTHTGEKPYKCDICQRSFGQKHTFTDHIRTHTGEKPYKCDICQRSFSQRVSLRNHIRIHTSVKNLTSVMCVRVVSVTKLL